MARTPRRPPPTKTPEQMQLEMLGMDPGMAQTYTQSFKKGGTVKRTSVYKLHKGEKVVPAKKPRTRRK